MQFNAKQEEEDISTCSHKCFHMLHYIIHPMNYITNFPEDLFFFLHTANQFSHFRTNTHTHKSVITKLYVEKEKKLSIII